MPDNITHPAPVSLRAALDEARARLSTATGNASAQLDADFLLRHVTGLSRAAVLAQPERQLTATQVSAFFAAIARRAQSEPIQYITGVQEFYGLAFAVTPAVLIPRPETEHLVEKAIAIATQQSGPLSIVDIGTGSGAIAVTLAHHLRSARITATDVSSAALDIARANAAKHAVTDRITFVECDLIPADEDHYDIICSNPPYIANSEILEPQVAAFEPQSALFAGPTGLENYQRLIPLAAARLHPGGWLLLEIGHGQQPSVESLLLNAHLQHIDFIPDLQGIPRVAVARQVS